MQYLQNTHIQQIIQNKPNTEGIERRKIEKQTDGENKKKKGKSVDRTYDWYMC